MHISRFGLGSKKGSPSTGPRAKKAQKIGSSERSLLDPCYPLSTWQAEFPVSLRKVRLASARKIRAPSCALNFNWERPHPFMLQTESEDVPANYHIPWWEPGISNPTCLARLIPDNWRAPTRMPTAPRRAA